MLSRLQVHSATGIPMTPSENEPATSRQCLNQLRYRLPPSSAVSINNSGMALSSIPVRRVCTLVTLRKCVRQQSAIEHF